MTTGPRLEEPPPNAITRPYRGLSVQEVDIPLTPGHVEDLLRRREIYRRTAYLVLRNEPHVVQADGYWVDFVPAGPLLFTYHRDRPGMIGRVGMLLGAADVNISGMHVGRMAPRDRAMMVLTLDDPVPPAILAKINAEEDIDRAYSVVL